MQVEEVDMVVQEQMDLVHKCVVREELLRVMGGKEFISLNLQQMVHLLAGLLVVVVVEQEQEMVQQE